MDSLVRGNDRGRNGNDKWDTCAALILSFLPEFEEESDKDTHEEAEYSGD